MQLQATKKYLGLSSECLGRDFDSITALNIIVYIGFAVLELIRRHEHDPRCVGLLFCDTCDEVKTIPFIYALEFLSVYYESIVTELDKVGCIEKGKLREAYEITNSIINDRYDAIGIFI